MKYIKTSLFTALLVISHTLAHSQYCEAVGPSQTTWSNVESASISGESGTSFAYTGCPGVVGLENLTGTHSVTLNANGSYTLSVLFGTCDSPWQSAGEAWIDYNGNEIFELSESIGTWQGTPPVPTSNFNFTVPASCANGLVRMRLTHQESVTPPLDPCASFTWGSTIDFEVVLTGGSGPNLSNYCESVGPGSSADSNVQEFNLFGEGSTAIQFTGCPGVIGLNNLTGVHSVDISPGNDYTASVLFGTCGGTFSGAGEAWIDYDMNGIFESTESIGTWSGMPPQSTDFIFNVPTGLAYGSTRLRVVHQEGGALPLDPCANYQWGSTIDFNVNIGEAVDCSGFEGDSMQDARMVQALPFIENHSNIQCYSNNVPIYNSPDVFYRILPNELGISALNVSLCGSALDTYLQILDKDGTVLISNDDYTNCSPQSEASLDVEGMDTIYAVVQGWNNEKGDYTITINDGDIVGVEKIEQNYSIYPNPTNNTLNVSGIQAKTLLRISDLNGRIVLERIAFSNTSLDVSELAGGVYILELITTTGQKAQKILVDHEK